MPSEFTQLKDNIYAGIDAYLDLPEHTYALLIDGEWGVGKTYCVKNYFDKQEADGPPTYVLVSLFGLGNLTELRASILKSLGKGARAAEIGARATGTLGDILGGIIVGDPNLGSKYTEQIYSKLDGLSDKIIFIFDDLERMTMPQPEALGFINSLVEEQARPVLLIANQDKIGDQLEWRSRREKLVGKTLKVFPDPANVIDLYIKSGTLCVKSQHVLRNFSRDLEDTFIRSSNSNLRSLKIALQDFDKIVRLLDNQSVIEDDHLIEIVKLLVVLTLEVKAGAIDTEHFHAFRQLKTRRILGDTSTKTDHASHEIKRICDEHLDILFDTPALEYRFIADLLNTGTFNHRDMNAWLEANFSAWTDFEPSWRKLSFLYLLEPSEVKIHLDNIRKELADHSITDPKALLAIAAASIDLDYHIDLIEKSKIIPFYKEYLHTVVLDVNIEDASDALDIESEFYLDAFSDADKITFNTIRRLLVEAINRQLVSNLAQMINIEIANAKSSGIGCLNFLGNDTSNSRLSKIPILASTSPEEFGDCLLRSVQDFQQGLRILAARYARSERSAIITSEFSWLQQLHQRLELGLRHWPEPTREMQRRYLHNSFVEIWKMNEQEKAY